MSNERLRRKEEEIDRLLVQLRDEVAQLQRRLEHSSRDGSDLHTSRHAIAALHWRLARIVSSSSLGGHPVAA